jgi:hypothetical protein
MTHGYRLAFDMGQPENLFGLWPLLVLPVGATVGLFFSGFVLNQRRSRRWASGWLFVAFSGTIVVLVLVANLSQGKQLQAAEAAGNAIVTEGCITHFHPADREGHDDEEVEVGARSFSYSDSKETPAFHQSESHGGPIHADSKVRITSVFGEIVRLETQDHACASAPAP